jgi:hypothetical protein
MIYVSYVFLTMTATAYFGKKYYRNTFIWFSLLEFALLGLIYNIIWRICGFYRHIMADDRPLNKVIHDLSMLRLPALILVLICCGFCTAVNIHSWRHYRRYNGEIRHSQDRRHLERSQSFIWRFIAVLHLYLFSYILPFLSRASSSISSSRRWRPRAYTFTSSGSKGSGTRATWRAATGSSSRPSRA